ncbi:MAG: VOC family protein [Acidobacteria bacterium]|nr:VOC family protein [Acidobacteriota bacterium]
MIVDKHKPGTFCWIELGSNNQPESKKFYTQLFDWTFEDVPMGPDSFYTMFQLDGKEVAALYQMSPEQLSQGIPSHWMLYISVESVDDTVK